MNATRWTTFLGVNPNSMAMRASLSLSTERRMGFSAAPLCPYDFAVPSPRTYSTMLPASLSVASCAAGASRRDVRLIEARARHETAVPKTAATAAAGLRKSRKHSIASRLT